MTICNRKHDVVALQIYDPRAKSLPDVGLIKVCDAETGHEMYIDTSDKRLRDAHYKYWVNRQKLSVLYSIKVMWTIYLLRQIRIM